MVNIITSEGVVIDLTEFTIEINFLKVWRRKFSHRLYALQDSVGATNIGPLIGQEYLQILINYTL